MSATVQPGGIPARRVARLLVGCGLILVAGAVATGMLEPRALVAADISEATAMFKAGKYLECADAAQIAIDDGQYSETWRLLKIRADLMTGRYEAALVTLEAALDRYQASVRLRWLGSRVLRHNDQAEQATKLLDEIDILTDGFSWRYSDPASRIALGRYYLERGADPKKIIDGVYTAVKKRVPGYTDAYIASGQLALDKNDFQLAAEEFGMALKMDASDPDIYFGLARAFASSDSEKADEHLRSALTRNPHHIDSLIMVADHHVDAERYEEADEVLQEILDINVREPRAWAYLAVLAHLRGDQVGEVVLSSTGLASWPENPIVEFIIGRKLAQKYRFAEAAAYQRNVLRGSPDYLPAKFELCQALLRLGQEAEGMRLAHEVNKLDGYNVVAHNLVTLQDKLKRYQTLEAPGFVVRMEPREAQLYGQRVLKLLEEARTTLCAKYNVTIDEPVLVEIFPRQADFAIRTFGLPGGDGFLGVCFGRVITANSPASRGNSPANWEAVLWHEFCHVVTLEKTRNKMPRWLSEGISVYEERQANSTWGQTMTPVYRQMILEGELTPVSRLSGAFLQPKSAMHLQFAYFESSLVVEFLIKRHGLETLQRVLDDLGVGMSINDSLSRYTGSLVVLDEEFATFARQQAEQMAPKADWTEADLPRDMDLVTLMLWVKTHPSHFVGMSRLAVALIRQKQWNEAKTLLKEIIALFPEYHEGGNAYTLLAQVHRELGETKEERAVLEQLTALSDDDVDALDRLMDLSIEQEDWIAALNTADRLLGINPLIAAPHRVIATAAEQLNDSRRAIPALRALVALDPIDPAGVHFRLAVHLTEQSEFSAARREVLRALEEAPRFRAAHRQLLVILEEIERTEKTTPSRSAAELETDTPPRDAPGKTAESVANKAGELPSEKSPPTPPTPAKSDQPKESDDQPKALDDPKRLDDQP